MLVLINKIVLKKYYFTIPMEEFLQGQLAIDKDFYLCANKAAEKANCFYALCFKDPSLM